MKHPAPYIRKKILELLSENVTHEGEAVPVYETEGKNEALMIVIGDYSDADRSNKHSFGANASQVIEVVSEQTKPFKRIVDEVGELVMNLIHPQVQSNLLSNANFTINLIGKPSINHIVEPIGDGLIAVRLILRFNLLINEN